MKNTHFFHKKSYTYVAFFFFAAIIATVILLYNYQTDGKDKSIQDTASPVRVGLSITDSNYQWINDQISTFEKAASDNNMVLVYHNIDQPDSQKQINDINTLISQDVSYLIIMPVDDSVLDVVFNIEKIKSGDLPLIVIADQIPDTAPYVFFIQTNYREEGQTCARIISDTYAGKSCNLIEIKGPANSYIATKRYQGFHDEIRKYSNMHIEATVSSDFNRQTAQDAMERLIASETSPKIDAIFSCSDEDGLGVLNALNLSGYFDHSDVTLVSIDGTQDILMAITAGEYKATVQSSPRLGYAAFDLIAQLERGYDGTHRILLPYRIYDSDNALTYLTNLF
jgi:ABC-type sugar transport system substrate-binding protein